MAITLGTGVATNVSVSAITWTVNLPSGYAANDVVVIFLGDNVGSTAGTPAATGWTAEAVVNESSALKGSFLWKKMTGSEGTTVSVTWGATCIGNTVAVACTGVDQTTAQDTTATGQAEPSASAVTAHATPSITPVTNGCMILSGFTTDQTATWTLAGDTEIGDTQITGVSSALYGATQTTAAAISKTATASVGSVKAVSCIMALRPAVVTASPNPLPRRRVLQAVNRSASF